MGVVYEAFDRERGEVIALKTIRESHGKGMYRIKREFRSIAELEHPNLIRLHDLFVDGEQCFFTMELVRGLELTPWTSAALPHADERHATLPDGFALFDERAVRHAVAGIAAGIDALHGAGLLHRDLKPSNVMVTHEGRVVVLDFGLVADAHAAAQQTVEGEVAGTIAYMAPEQARGEVELTRAIDAYALGVVLYELLTGRLPHEGPPLMMLAAKQRAERVRPSQRTGGIPLDLDDLTSALLAHDPTARPTMAEVRRVIGEASHPSARGSNSNSNSNSRESLPALFGRAAELAKLHIALDATANGTPGVFLLRGRSGIGKSALIAAFTRQAERDQRAVVFAGRCHERETVPFKGLDGVVDALSRHLAAASPAELGRLLPPNTADLGTLFPVLRRIPPIASAYARRASSERSKQRVRAEGFACLAEMLRRIGDVAPLIVVVDDVQWADADTATGIIELLRGAAPPSMFLLLGTRLTDASPVEVAIFGREAAPTVAALQRETLQLGDLDDDSIGQIAHRELGRHASDALVAAVARDAHGNPFAAGELVRFLREDDSGDVDPSEEMAAVTTSIDALVRRRAQSLDDAARRLLDVIVIAGEPTAAAVLLQAAEIDEGDRSAVERLRARHWVRTSRAAATGALDTVHDRVREAMLEGLDGTRRAHLHRRLAIALEAQEDPPHDRLARHFAAAGDRSLAFHHAVEAAQVAQAALALRRAAELFGMAIELGSDDETRVLYPTYAESLAAAGRHEAAADAWIEASRRVGGREVRELLRRAGEAKLHAGLIDEGLDLLDALANDVGVRIPLHRWAVVWELVKGQLRLGVRGLAFMLRPASEIRRSELDRVRTLGAIALQYMPLDPFRGAVATLRYVRAALDVGDADEIATAVGLESSLRSGMGWRRGAQRLLVILDALATESASARDRAWAAIARSMSGIMDGDRRSAMANIDIAFDQIATLQSPPQSLLGMAHYVGGFSLVFDISPAPFARLLAYVEAREEQSGPSAELRLRGLVVQVHHLLMGRPESVLALADDGCWTSATRRDIAFRTTADLYVIIAHLYLGDATRALAVAHGVEDGYRRQGTSWSPYARGVHVWFTAASALGAGDTRTLRRCRRSLGRPRDGFLQLFVPVIQAMCAYAEGNLPAMRDALHRLHSLAAPAGFTVLEALADWALARVSDDLGGEEVTARYLTRIEGSGLVDPDLFFWSRFPVGERPARTGTTRSVWSSA